MEFIIGPFITWLPTVFFWAVFVVLSFLYAVQSFLERKGKIVPPVFGKIYKMLPVILISFYAFYASLKTFAQYYVWSRSSFGKLLLPPYQDLSYFLFYSFGRFWLNALLAVATAFLFYLLLKRLNRYRSGLFKDGEMEAGFATALLSGWPGFAVFVPLVFIVTTILSIIRSLAFKLKTTTLGSALLISAAIILIWGSELITFFHLNVLKV